jgi:hypothetical protein
MDSISSMTQDVLYNGSMIIVKLATNDARKFWAVASNARSHDRWRVRIVETYNARDERDVACFVKCSADAVLPSIIETIQADLAAVANK